MNAKEARKKTEENILSSSNEQKNKIDELITIAISKMSFGISFPVPKIHEKNVLKEHYTVLGYVWKEDSGSGDMRCRTPSSIALSW